MSRSVSRRASASEDGICSVEVIMFLRSHSQCAVDRAFRPMPGTFAPTDEVGRARTLMSRPNERKHNERIERHP
jgi:hypothetical protein